MNDEAGASESKDDGALKVLKFIELMDKRLIESGFTHEQRMEITRILMTTKV